MAVQLQREVRDTGVQAEYWVLISVALNREGTTNNFRLAGVYQLWLDEAAYSAGKSPIRGERVSVTTGVLTGNPTAGQMQAALDAAVVDAGLQPKPGPLVGGTVV